MSKRKLLLTICEQPGWQPSQPVGQQTELHLAQLQGEGWIAPRLDGWEATAAALEAYPSFTTQPDIKDPDWDDVYVTPPQAAQEVGAEDRLMVFIYLLLAEHLTIGDLHIIFRRAMDEAATHAPWSGNVYPRAIAQALITGKEVE